MYKLVVFDVAGTIVSDDGIVIDSFSSAFQEVVPELWSTEQARFTDYAQKTMGQSKIEVFYAMLGDQRLAALAADRFQQHYLANIEKTELFDGVLSMFEILRSKGIKIALNTGFDRVTLDTMIDRFGIRGLVSHSATPQEAGAGRPSPAMLRMVANQAGVADTSMVAVLGDTATDIETAATFGAGLKIGVLSGAHGLNELENAGADLIFDRAPQALPHLIG